MGTEDVGGRVGVEEVGLPVGEVVGREDEGDRVGSDEDGLTVGDVVGGDERWESGWTGKTWGSVWVTWSALRG